MTTAELEAIVEARLGAIDSAGNVAPARERAQLAAQLLIARHLEGIGMGLDYVDTKLQRIITGAQW